jgi:Tfp pilus assembly protein PilN
VRPINLLPRADRRDGRARAGLAAAVITLMVFIALLVVGVIWWEGRVATARDDLAAQEAVNRSLERDLAALAPARDLRNEYEDRADFVRAALARDVDWGLLLNDLARLIPPRVWVETFSGTVSGAGTAGTLGRVSFTGIGFDFPDVSEWLRSLDSQQFRGLTGTWVSSISRGTFGDSDIVNFNSTAALSPDAGTARAERLIPEIP